MCLFFFYVVVCFRFCFESCFATLQFKDCLHFWKFSSSNFAPLKVSLQIWHLCGAEHILMCFIRSALVRNDFVQNSHVGVLFSIILWHWVIWFCNVCNFKNFSLQVPHWWNNFPVQAFSCVVRLWMLSNTCLQPFWHVRSIFDFWSSFKFFVFLLQLRT